MKHIWIVAAFCIPLVCSNKPLTVEPDFCENYEVVQLKEYSESDLYLLARLIYCEARGESREGMIAVANVVINRSNRGKTIRQVILRPGQFDGVRTSQFKRYNQSTLEAARVALQGYKVIPDHVYYFYNPITSTDSKWIKRLTTYRQIGNHVFAWY